MKEDKSLTSTNQHSTLPGALTLIDYTKQIGLSLLNLPVDADLNVSESISHAKTNC